MPIRRQSVTVLRLWYRLTTTSEVQALSHPGFRWFTGLALSWSGFNNGALTFTQRRHGKAFGLSHPETFERARAEVLETGLVLIVDKGGKNRPAQYALSAIPLQVAITTPGVATNAENVATAGVAIDEKIATSGVVSCYGRRSKKNDLYRRSRARLNKKAISKSQRATSVESQSATATNSEAGQGGNGGTAHIGVNGEIPPLVSRH
jgi:hypothetical protein